MSVTAEQVMAALSHVIEPELHKDLVTLNMVIRRASKPQQVH